MTNCSIDYFGIEAEPGLVFVYLDLNQPGAAQHLTDSRTYDLVVCSQVLEHIWNVAAAFESLSALTSDGGYLWVGVPASNFPHGFPDYYCAGYSPKFLEQWATHTGLEVIFAECIGSERYYSWIHRYRYWPTAEETSLTHAIAGRGDGPLIRRWGREIKRVTRAVVLSKTSPAIRGDINSATESFCVLKKPELNAAPRNQQE